MTTTTPGLRNKRTTLTRTQVEFIVQAYKIEGRFLCDIAKELGLYPQIIGNCLKRNGVKKIKRSPNRAKGEKNGHWKGGRRLQKGYMEIKAPGHPNARPSNGYIYEHRLVMSEHLKRPLKDEEVVHHINGDTLDNRIENLELVESNGKHISEHIPKWKRNTFGRFSEKEDIPSNCVILEWNGEKHHMSEWARKIGISKGGMEWRIKNGKKGEALFAPSSRS